jgi:hypothetical protein
MSAKVPVERMPYIETSLCIATLNGTPAQPVTVIGPNVGPDFVADSVVRWNGSDLSHHSLRFNRAQVFCS